MPQLLYCPRLCLVQYFMLYASLLQDSPLCTALNDGNKYYNTNVIVKELKE